MPFSPRTGSPDMLASQPFAAVSSSVPTVSMVLPPSSERVSCAVTESGRMPSWSSLSSHAFVAFTLMSEASCVFVSVNA